MDCVTDNGPGCGPADGEVLAHGDRMLCAADWPVAVVVDLDVIGSPNQRDAPPENGGAEEIKRRFLLSFPMLNLENKKIMSIGGNFIIPKLTIDIPIFHNFLLTSPIASNYLIVDERKKSLADNPQFIINYNS